MKEPENELPFVSIVVVTLERKDNLKKCLECLFNLDYPSERFEVIVVDGDSRDGTKGMIARDFPKVKFIVEKKKGLPYARNAGWKHAQGSFVAYTDDDCIVSPSWLRHLVNGFSSKEIGAVGGPVLYLHPELMPNQFNKTPLGVFYLGETERLLKPNENLITANIAIRSQAFNKARFLESLIYSDSEDYEFCWTLMEIGYRIKYLPDAKVLHDINPKRVTMNGLIRRAFFSGISHYIVERKRKSRPALIPKFLRLFLGGFYSFLTDQNKAKRMADFFWISLCFIAFLSSVFLIFKDFNN
jgi:glycosyltransferase involved in cell wall biosynthesis